MTVSFTAPRGVLVDALSAAALAVSTRPNLPILGGVLLESADIGITVSAFDYETAVTVHVPETYRVTGRLLINHREITKLLAALVKGVSKKAADGLPVTITAQDSGADAVVKLNGHTVPLESYPVEDYPAMPAVPSKTVMVARPVFTDEARRVLVATGRDDTLPFLTGVSMQFGTAGVVLAATDRYRLCEATVPFVVGHPGLVDQSALVYGPTLTKVLKHLPAKAGIEIGVGDDGNVSFHSGGVTVITRTLSAAFPKYNYIIPAERDVTVVADRAALLLATQRAAAVLEAKGVDAAQIGVTVQPFGGVSVAAVLPDRAAAVVAPALPAEVLGSITEDRRYLLNPKYLLDALGTFTGDTITMHARATNKPVVFTDHPDGFADRTVFRHLVTPIKPPGK